MEEEQFRGEQTRGEQARGERGGREPAVERVSQEGVERLRTLLGSRPVAMLTTLDPGGSMRSRPMAVQEINDQGEAFLITQRSSPKVEEVSHEHHVNLSFFRPLRGRYISVSGRATAMRDDDKLRQLWHPTLQAWFPDGLDDPDLCLLRVRIDKAETWNAPVGNLLQVARLAGSVLGKSPKPTHHEEGRDTLVIRIPQPGIGDTPGMPRSAMAPFERPLETKLREPKKKSPEAKKSEVKKGGPQKGGMAGPPPVARSIANAMPGGVATMGTNSKKDAKQSQAKPDRPVAHGEAAPRRGGRGK